MPNWCNGFLKITGKKDELQKFKTYAESDNKDKDSFRVLDTQKFIPYPEEYKKQDEVASRIWELKTKEKLTPEETKELLVLTLEGKDVKNGFNSGGYDWCCNNWGTKWGICHPGIEEEDNKMISYYFDTAWSPCDPVILKMSEMFPKLNFNYKYYEGGMGFRGIFICKKGKVLKDKNYNYRG